MFPIIENTGTSQCYKSAHDETSNHYLENNISRNRETNNSKHWITRAIVANVPKHHLISNPRGAMCGQRLEFRSKHVSRHWHTGNARFPNIGRPHLDGTQLFPISNLTRMGPRFPTLRKYYMDVGTISIAWEIT